MLQAEYFDVICCSLSESSRDSQDSCTCRQVICVHCAFSLWKGHLSSPGDPEGVITDRCDHPRLSRLSPLSLSLSLSPNTCSAETHGSLPSFYPFFVPTIFKLNQKLPSLCFAGALLCLSNHLAKFLLICKSVFCVLKGEFHPFQH